MSGLAVAHDSQPASTREKSEQHQKRVQKTIFARFLTAANKGRYLADGPMLGGLHRTWGPTVVLWVDGIDILVVSLAAQILDLQQFKAFGIDPAAKKVVALKSMQHFRAAFEPIAAKVIVCDGGALCTPDCAALAYRNAPPPIFPLDRNIDLIVWRRANA